MRGLLWQTLQKDLYYPLVADKNSYNSANFEARSLKFCMVVDLDNTHRRRMTMMTKMMMNMIMMSKMMMKIKMAITLPISKLGGPDFVR